MKSTPFVFQAIPSKLIINQGVVESKVRSLKYQFKNHHLSIQHPTKSSVKPYQILLLNPESMLNIQISWQVQANQNVNIFYFLNETSQTSEITLSLAKDSIAKVNLVLLGKSAHHEMKLTTLQETSSTLDFALCLIGGNHQIEQRMLLQGENANLEALGLSVHAQQEKVVFKEAIEHQKPLTSSYVTNYLVSNQQAFIQCEISGKIHKGNHGSNCRQHSRGVITEVGGAIQVDPLLLIDEFDVEAGHGAAVGEINPEELYYLQSRGLTELEAKRLIISGFMKPFLDRYDYVPFASYLESQIEQVLKGSDSFGT